MTLTESVYVVAGILLPAYYVPQMLKCAVDETRLAAYSMSKAASQLALRMAMLPFVFGFDNLTMTCVVALDFGGRASEFAIAVWSLSRQGATPREILNRCLPFGRLRDVGRAPRVLPDANWSSRPNAAAGSHDAGPPEPDRSPSSDASISSGTDASEGPLSTWLRRREG